MERDDGGAAQFDSRPGFQALGLDRYAGPAAPAGHACATTSATNPRGAPPEKSSLEGEMKYV